MLTSIVLAVVGGAAAVVALALVRAVVEPSDATRRAAPIVLAVVTGLVVVVWARRWVDTAVVALVDGVDDRQLSAIAVIDHELTADSGPDRYLSELASAAATLLRVPFVAFDVDPTPGADAAAIWSASSSASSGASPSPSSIVVRPVRMAGVEIGRITVAGRAGGHALSAEDVAAVDAIGRQAAMVIANARQAEALHRSRERAVSGIEEERRRLRRDLHDELGPNLAAMKLQLGVLRRTGDLTPAAGAIVDELTASVDTTTADVRRLVEDLRPPLLDDLGLPEALRCLKFVPDELALTLESDDDLKELPAATQVALYRIGSEAIRNVVRHATATSCTVRLRRTEAAVTLTVVDDGRGVGDQPAGVGVAAMRERADELGGLLTISPGPGERGCCIAATIPLNADPGLVSLEPA